MVVVLPRDAIEKLVQRICIVHGSVTEDLDGNFADGKARMVEKLIQCIQLEGILCFLCDILRLWRWVVDLVVLDDDGHKRHHAAEEGAGGQPDAHEGDALIAHQR